MFQRTLTSSINYAILLINHNAEAWHIVKTLDPLIDSDDEDITDYNVHVDIGERPYRCGQLEFAHHFSPAVQHVD